MNSVTNYDDLDPANLLAFITQFRNLERWDGVPLNAKISHSEE